MKDARYRRPITMGNGVRRMGGNGMFSMCGAGNDKVIFFTKHYN
jgi:hypothetical protein